MEKFNLLYSNVVDKSYSDIGIGGNSMKTYR